MGIATLVVRSLSNRALLRFPNGEIFVEARKRKTRGAASTVS
ncbi:hypothetical protein [Georgenia sp. SUBG003]